MRRLLNSDDEDTVAISRPHGSELLGMAFKNSQLNSRIQVHQNTQ